MADAAEIWRAAISEVGDGYVRCRGVFKTYGGVGHPERSHASLSPTVLTGECPWRGDPKLGDVMVAYSDGTYKHEPRPA